MTFIYIADQFSISAKFHSGFLCCNTRCSTYFLFAVR